MRVANRTPCYLKGLREKAVKHMLSVSVTFAKPQVFYNDNGVFGGALQVIDQEPNTRTTALRP